MRMPHRRYGEVTGEYHVTGRDPVEAAQEMLEMVDLWHGRVLPGTIWQRSYEYPASCFDMAPAEVSP